jgi:hypothetical protein
MNQTQTKKECKKMNMVKAVKRLVEGFMDYANVGFRYIDVPRYNTKLYHEKGVVARDKKRVSA